MLFFNLGPRALEMLRAQRYLNPALGVGIAHVSPSYVHAAVVDIRQHTTTTRNEVESCKVSFAMEMRAESVSAKLRQSKQTDKRINLTMQLLRSWTGFSFEEQLTWRKLLKHERITLSRIR